MISEYVFVNMFLDAGCILTITADKEGRYGLELRAGKRALCGAWSYNVDLAYGFLNDKCKEYLFGDLSEVVSQYIFEDRPR